MEQDMRSFNYKFSKPQPIEITEEEFLPLFSTNGQYLLEENELNLSSMQ